MGSLREPNAASDEYFLRLDERMRTRIAKNSLNYQNAAMESRSIWLAEAGRAWATRRVTSGGAAKGDDMAVTHDDAKVFMDLVRWSSEIGLDSAMSDIFREGFDATTDTASADAARTVLMFGETAGALVKHGVLAWELLSDLFWIEGMWAKVGSYAQTLRGQLGEARLYEHFEMLANRAVD